MIDLVMHLSTVLYTVNIEPALAIPVVYFIALLVCVLLREFTHGPLRYILALLFVGSFSALWFIMMSDYSPWQIVLVLVIIAGGISGLWNWIRDIFSDVKKL
jgi:hypothetical protein